MIVRGENQSLTNCEPGVKRKVLAYDDALMMCEVRFEKGAEGYLHSHPHRQITYVRSGRFRFQIDGAETTVDAGDSLLIPPNARHGVTALTEGVLIDVFSPMRETFL